MLKPKIKNLSKYKKVLGVLAISAVVVGSTAIAGLARADQYDDQIKILQQQNDASQRVVNSLAAQANNYQSAVNALQSQIDGIQQGIVATQHEIDSLTNQINQAQDELNQQKKVLGEDIKTMYLQGQTSTLEILAASKNLNEFVDQQEYRYTVQNKIKAAVDKINALKLQLEQQQREQQALLKQQQDQRAQLQASQDQQNQMLAYTEDQKNSYTQQIKAANAQISSLRVQQAAAYAAYIRRSGVSSYSVGEAGNGGYPPELASALQDTIVDNWGMLNRECVSYVAWKVNSTGHYMPYWGAENANAYNWVNLANKYGIPNGTSAQQGSVVIWQSGDGMGFLGHAAYVEQVNGDGSIEVSQYNVVHGQFSRMHVDASLASSLHYIYF